MSKTSKRVLSWVMTVLMVVSLLSSFAIPAAFAADAVVSGPDVANAYYVNYTWTTNGANVSFTWEGQPINAKVGEKAFADVTSALAAAKTAGNNCPDILLVGWSASTNLIVMSACNIYAPNWNTVPYIRDAQQGDWKAVNSNGADWTYNTAYDTKKITCNNLMLDGQASGEINVYGLTIKDCYYIGGYNGAGMTLRNTSSPALDMSIVNCVIDIGNNTSTNGGDWFRNGYGNSSATQQDTLTLKNVYFKNVRGGDNARIFPDACMPSHIVFDGVYFDANAARQFRGSYIKQPYAATGSKSITFKNSNFRNLGTTQPEKWAYPNYFEFAGNTAPNDANAPSKATITLENNIFYNNKAANKGVIYYRPCSYSDITIKGNHFENPYSFTGMGLISGDGSASAVKNITVTGNKLLGFNRANTVDGANYATGFNGSYNVSGNFLVKDNGKTNTQYQTSKGEAVVVDGKANGAYYLDYNMTVSSADVELKDFKLGANDEVEINGFDIMVNAKQNATAIKPTVTVGSKAKYKISTKADFSDSVETVDVSVKESVATYYIRAYVEGSDVAYLDYTLTVAVEKSAEVIDFESENAYIINKDWTDQQLAGEDDLTIWFNGKDRTVNPKTDKLFNSFDKAHAAAFATLSAENYFTLNPIFVFGPGDYGAINLYAPATIYGAYAGISPNEELPEGAMDDFDYVKTNGGWKANAERVAANETILTYSLTTRTANYNDNGSVGFSGEDGKWAYFKQKAFNISNGSTLTVTVDGITLKGTAGFTGHAPNLNVTYNDDTIKITTSNHNVKGVFKNVTTTANKLIQAWNSTNDIYTVDFYNLRSTGAVSQFHEKYIDYINIYDSFLANVAGDSAMVKGFNNGSKNGAKMVIEDSILYNFTSGSAGVFSFTIGNGSYKDQVLELKNNVLYNAGNANYGDFRPYNTNNDAKTITYTITDNIIYRDTKTNTLFNGNPNYVTMGKVYLTFNGNSVISTNSSLLPNVNYSDNAWFKSHFFIDFNNNYWATPTNPDAKPIVFNPEGRPIGGDGYSGDADFNYNDPVFYLDFDQQYKSTDAKITAIEAGSGNVADVDHSTNPNIVTLNVLNKAGTLTAASIKTSGTNVVKLYDGSTEITSIDLTKVSGVKDYTVKVGFAGTTAVRTYTLRVIDGAVDFNAALKNGGITYGDKTFTAANTVAFAPSGQATYTDKNGSKYFYQYFNGTLYKYTIDNENVFAWATKNITLNSLAQRSSEGSQNPDGTWNWARSGLDLEKVKAKAENGNVILAGENFSASGAQIIVTYPTSIYGLNAGVNPVNKASATAANDYTASLTAEWGQHGQTKLGTVRIGNAKDGDIVFDGVTLAERVYDTVRYEMYDSKDEALNVVFKNIVIDNAAGGGSIFCINNALTTNGSGAGAGDGAGNLPVTDAGKEFGKIYNDSFTLENCFVRKSATNHVFDEQIPANVTVRNYYEDCSTSGRVRNLFGFMKTGAYNMISNITIEDCIVRGNATQTTNRIIHSEGPRGAISGTDYGVNMTIRNNVFFNSTGTAYIRVAPSYTDNLVITGNTFVANASMKVYENHGGAKDIANVTISDNRYVGFADANISHTAMEANLTEVNGFATTDANAYKNANGYTGYKATAFGTNDYYVNFGMTAKASEFAITKLEAGTSDIKDITVDTDNRKIQFSLARGTTEGISVVLAGDNAKWFFSTDADGKNKINVISREDLRQLVSTYYFNIDVNGVVLTYEMEILNDIVPDFAEVEGLDPAYFSNDAVIVTDKAANLAVGTEIFEQWDGQWYRFYAGVNAFATIEDALKIDAEVAEVIITKLNGNTDPSNGDNQRDISVSRSMKLYGPNYKTNPVLSDGYGANSPSKGADWGLNPAFDANKDLVRVKTVTAGANASVAEFYGFTIDRSIFDRYRNVDSAPMKYKFVNTYFALANATNEIIDVDSDCGNNKRSYMDENQTNSLYVKNAYFGETTKTNLRLINELSFAKVTFDNIYLDFAKSGLTNTSYIKQTAKDGNFIIKNSYLNANFVKDSNGHLQFEGLYKDGANGDGLKNSGDVSKFAVPEGWNNSLIFDNNIIIGALGYVSGTNYSNAAVVRVAGQSFNDLQFTNNYVDFPATYTQYISSGDNKGTYTREIKSSQLFYSLGDKSGMDTLEGTYTITGNVFNGLTHTGLTYNNGSGGTNTYFGKINHVIYDNFISQKLGGNAFADDNIGVAPFVGPVDTTNIGYYRLTADGTKLSNVIQDMTWSDRVTFSGTTAIANIYDCDNIYTVTENANADDPTVIDSYTYKFDLSSLVKANKYGNNITVAFGDGEAVDLETGKLEITRDTKIAPDTAIRVTVTVDSPDGRADEQTYTFVIFMNGGDAPAFKGNFKDDANIISNNAVIVTSTAAGATGTVNAQWMGETYSFTVGENAFANVADALAYAKTNADKFATAPIEILLVESSSTTDLKIDYSCKIYAENYNTLPYVADGYGIDSVSYGENWYENAAYVANQTEVGGIYITSATPNGSVIEVHGVTIKGIVGDNARAIGNTATVLFNNIRVDYDNAAKNWESVTGNKTGGNYWLNLGSPSNVNDKGNSFTLKNAHLVDLLNGTTNTALVGEFIPQNFTLDGVYANDAAAIGMVRGSWWIKYNVDDTVFTIKNSNLQKIMKDTTSKSTTWLYLTVNDDKLSTTDKKTDIQADVVFENNILNSFQARAFGSGSGSLIDLTTDAVNTVTFEKNYIANPYNENGTAIALISSSGRSSVDHTDITVNVKDNVLNGVSWLDIGISGTYAKTVNAYIEGNYRVASYVENLRDADVVGTDLGINHHTAKTKYFALDYDRTLMSNVVGDMTVVDGKNILIDEDNNTVTYAYNELVTKNASDAITVDLTAFTTLTNKYNSVVAVLSDGTEKDLSTIFTYDGATLGETLTLKVYSYDKGVSKTTYTVTFVEGAHAMGEWVPYTEAGCGINATEIQRCNVDECTIDEGTCGHYVTREVEGTALPHQLPESGYYNDDATCLADGTQTVYCKDCGEPVVIPAPGTKRTYHSYTNYVANNDGTCMVDGTMTAVCDWCHENASTVLNPEDTKEINKDNHLYGEYIYNNDATCLADGTQTRYCIHEDAQGTVCGHADETVTAEGTMIEHDWSQYVYNNDETCQNNGTETATCPGVAEENGVAPECGATDTREVEGTKLDHHVFEEDDYVLTTEATCTTPGYETAPCKYAYDGCTETHTRLNPEKYPINPDNHDYAKPVYQEDATCVTDGTQTRKCKRDGCGYVLTETAPGTAGQGTHIWGEYVANNDADCVHDGTMTASCIADPNCTAKDTVINPNDPAGKKAHTWGEYVYNNDATCVKDGTKTATCTVDGCGATDTEKDTDHLKSTVPHTYTDWKSNNDATCTADGTKTRECTADRCYHTETVKDEGTMKPHAWGEYKYNNDATYLADGTKTAKCTTCTATNTITAAGTKTPLKTIVNTASKFVDVKAGAWYKNAVDYAVTYGLISGTTETTFEPNGTITRGMFVTILARAAGVDTSAAANKAAKTQFNDVAAGKYYAAAIAWASSKQIVAGMTNTEFAPDAPIARQQLAVMIYRFAASQGVTLKAKKTVSFADAATVSTWAKDGVAACAAAGIVNGYTENGKTYFKPYKTATRAEATQMIYMFHAEYITGTIK